MKVLHTSDWHLGRVLYGRKRGREAAAFLDWLAGVIEEQQVEALLVAGDVFDSGMPGAGAQEMYYRFLRRVAESKVCRHVVIVGGNHDSPSFLEAPRELLAVLDVHVVGGAAENPADEVLVLKDAQGRGELVVCAVPYLRERDLRLSVAGEAAAEKSRKGEAGLRGHYAAVAQAAAQVRTDGMPVVAMGHLFAAGGQTVEGDGVRELVVGGVERVRADVFAPVFDYVALGHLHVPQVVDGRETVRYSGSPLAMGFGEAGQQKSVCVVELAPGEPAAVEVVPVPVFQRLERVTGDWAAIAERLAALAAKGESVWVEVVYAGAEVLGDLRERVELAVAETGIVVLRVVDERVRALAMEPRVEAEALADLDAFEVFERCLAAHEVPEEQWAWLKQAYAEVVQGVHDKDAMAEQG